MKSTRTFTAILCALALTGTAFTSCQDYAAMEEDEIRNFETSTKYSNNFINHYGQPDPNHTWGMGAINPCLVSSYNSNPIQTRATVDNKNQWAPLDESQNIYHLQVPGWPDVFKYNDGTDGDYGYLTDDAGYKTKETLLTSQIPGGDVTDEEIKYVSWWFRTHQYPSSVTLHWTDFFVQEVSSDYDRNSEGAAITSAYIYEKSAKDVPFEIKETTNVNMKEDYFSAYTIEPQIDQDGNVIIDEYGKEQHWDHIKCFNEGRSNSLRSVVDVPMNGEDWWADLKDESNADVNISHRLIAFFESSGTEDFRAHYSDDNTDRNKVKDKNGVEHNSWVLVHLVFDGQPDATGKRRHYDGYYLGFDYEHYSQESWAQAETSPGVWENDYINKYARVDADGYYSNWIVKLSPATPEENPEYTGQTRRVMCEDLGNTYDFDFNDVVFDATYNITKADYAAYYNGTKKDSPIDVTIRLQAAGGTMPIYVGKMPNDADGIYEAHNMLGNNPSNTPINVGGKSNPIAIYHIKITVDPNNPSEALNLNSIPIYVVTSGNSAEGVRNGHYIINGGETSYSPSNPGESNVPQKFAVPNTVRWMRECQFIETAYPKFVDWVRDEWGAYRITENYYPTYNQETVPAWRKAWCDDENIDENNKGKLY